MWIYDPSAIYLLSFSIQSFSRHFPPQCLAVNTVLIHGINQQIGCWPSCSRMPIGIRRDSNPDSNTPYPLLTLRPSVEEGMDATVVGCYIITMYYFFVFAICLGKGRKLDWQFASQFANGYWSGTFLFISDFQVVLSTGTDRNASGRDWISQMDASANKTWVCRLALSPG